MAARGAAQGPAQPSGAEDGWTALAVAEAAGPPGDAPDDARSRFGQTGARTLAGLGGWLADPRLVLAWLLAGLGAPLALIGLLVPVPAACGLVGQILAARRREPRERPKWFWVGGSTVAGIALILMALAATLLAGSAAGWAVILCLAFFGLGQGVATVAGQAFGAASLGRDRSGAVLAQAGQLACFGAGALALYLVFLGEGDLGPFLGLVLAIAGVLLIYAAATIARLPAPPPGPQAPQDRPGSDPALARLLAVRALFIAITLLPPFLVVLVQQAAGGGLAALGQLVLAAAVASGVAPAAWAGLAEASARRLLMAAGGLGAVVAGGLGLLVLALPAVPGLPLVGPAVIFLVVLASAGLRQGLAHALAERPPSSAAAALGDGAIALVLLLGGLAGLVAEAAGIGIVLLLLAAMAGTGAWLALSLPEVRREG